MERQEPVGFLVRKSSGAGLTSTVAVGIGSGCIRVIVSQSPHTITCRFVVFHGMSSWLLVVTQGWCGPQQNLALGTHGRENADPAETLPSWFCCSASACSPCY